MGWWALPGKQEPPEQRGECKTSYGRYELVLKGPLCLDLRQWGWGEEPRTWHRCGGGEDSGRSRSRSHCNWLSKATLVRS